jgi:hypothetical protein
MKNQIGPYNLNERSNKGDLLRISRQIFNDIKRFIKSGKSNDAFSYSFLPDTEKKKAPKTRQEVTIGVRVASEQGEFAFKDGGEMFLGMIGMHFTLNPDAFPMAFNDLNVRIKSLLEHEFEHYQQYQGNRDFEKSTKLITSEYQDPDQDFHKYLMSPYEIPAWTTQIAKVAKYHKVSMPAAIELELRRYDNSLKNPKHRKAVKDAWIKYGKKRFPDANWEMSEQEKLDEAAPIKFFVFRVGKNPKELAGRNAVGKNGLYRILSYMSERKVLTAYEIKYYQRGFDEYEQYTGATQAGVKRKFDPFGSRLGYKQSRDWYSFPPDGAFKYEIVKSLTDAEVHAILSKHRNPRRVVEALLEEFGID